MCQWYFRWNLQLILKKYLKNNKKNEKIESNKRNKMEMGYVLMGIFSFLLCLRTEHTFQIIDFAVIVRCRLVVILLFVIVFHKSQLTSMYFIRMNLILTQVFVLKTQCFYFCITIAKGTWTLELQTMKVSGGLLAQLNELPQQWIKYIFGRIITYRKSSLLTTSFSVLLNAFSVEVTFLGSKNTT